MFTLFLISHLLLVASLVADVGDLLVALTAQPQAWGTLLGVGAPLLVAVLKQPWVAPRFHRPLAVAVAGLIGLATVLAAGQFNPADLVTTLALVLIASQTTYVTFWKPRQITARVESATNVGARAGGDFYA